MPNVEAEQAALIAGRYQCGPVIGRGGMAEVWAGRDLRLDRPVAIKPGNILVGPDGQWKVGDFGIAKAAELPAADDTASGFVRGTPAYLAPERFYGAAATVQTDLYALGAVLYESLTGHKPLQAPNNGAWATIAGTTPPAPLRSARTGVDADLAGAVERCLRKDPAERFLSALDMLAALTPTGMEPTHVGTVGATTLLDATEPLPAKEQPPARPGHRRRVVVGALVALAVLTILAAVIGRNTVGDSSGGPAIILRCRPRPPPRGHPQAPRPLLRSRPGRSRPGRSRPSRPRPCPPTPTRQARTGGRARAGVAATATTTATTEGHRQPVHGTRRAVALSSGATGRS